MDFVTSEGQRIRPGVKPNGLRDRAPPTRDTRDSSGGFDCHCRFLHFLRGGGTINAAAATVDPSGTTLSPASVSFGTQPLEKSSSAEADPLTNSGKTALHITGIGVSGTNASNFVQTNNCGTSLAAGAKCTINITFTPSASGTRSATLSVADSASEPPSADRGPFRNLAQAPWLRPVFLPQA